MLKDEFSMYVLFYKLYVYIICFGVILFCNDKKMFFLIIKIFSFKLEGNYFIIRNLFYVRCLCIYVYQLLVYMELKKLNSFESYFFLFLFGILKVK